MPDDRDRLRAEYERRVTDASVRERERSGDPAHVFLLQSRERDVLALLRRAGFDLSSTRVLDVGSGSGEWLRSLLGYGSEPELLCGIDLLPDRVARARHLNPTIDFRCGSAEALPYEDGRFDLVAQFTVFSSILDETLQNRVATEMWRVLRPGGAVLWYDFWVNPLNPATRPVGRRGISRLFPFCNAIWKRTTLAPPLARFAVRRLWALGTMLELLPFLRTHYLALLIKGPAC